MLSLGLMLMFSGCRQPKVTIPFDMSLSEPTDSMTREPNSEPKKPKKAIKAMGIEEALEAAEYYEFINHQALLISTYQHIIATSKDPDIVATNLTKLADLYLIDGNFAEAKRYYKKVIALYPGHKGIERARYREILAHFLSSLAPTRDQATTQATITLGKKYLEDFPHVEAGKVRGILAAAYKKLLASELLVVNFYLNKYALSGAIQPIKAALQRMMANTTIILPQLKAYDVAYNVMQSDPAWSHQILVAWDVEDIDIHEERQRVALRIQQAVSLLDKIVALDQATAMNFVNPRDKF